jgi:hypothetical protein
MSGDTFRLNNAEVPQALRNNHDIYLPPSEVSPRPGHAGDSPSVCEVVSRRSPQYGLDTDRVTHCGCPSAELAL